MKKKIKVFISHTHADAPVVTHFVATIDEKKCDIFYSSDENKGINAGQGVSATLDTNMNSTDIFIPVITEKYIRSIYCLYELSVACFLKSLGKKIEICPLCTSKEVYDKLKSLMARFDAVAILATEPKKVGKTKVSFKSIIRKDANLDKELKDFWDNLPSCDENKGPYIGGKEDFDNILSYCYNNGVKRLTNSYCKEDVLKGHIAKADQITIVSTTGDSLIKTLKDSIVTALTHGCEVRIVLPNQYSEFISDVAESEMVNTPNDKPAHIVRLAQEFANIFGYLKEAYSIAKSKTGKNKLGTVAMYSAFNCFRQTVTMTRKGDKYWSWTSFTMPPARAINGTPSLMTEGKKEEGNVINALTKHCETIIQIAKNKNAFINIDENTVARPFYLESKTAREYWEDKTDIAKENMERQLENKESVLIEVAAQHPLFKGRRPSIEFTRRLDAAISIYKEYKAKDIPVKIIVPGSLHKYLEHKDKISLSKAGANYLISKKISKNDIYTEPFINKYVKDGMYNSADECYVASKLFFDKDFTKLICVCSPYQAHRKTLFYIQFGIIPLCYCVPANRMHHSPIKELFDNLPNVIYKDHSWQDPNSEAYKNSRLERKP